MYAIFDIALDSDIPLPELPEIETAKTIIRIRAAHHWEPGLELIVIDTAEGVLLKQKTPFMKTRLKDVAACLHYSGNPKSIEDMEQAIKQGIKEQTNGCD